MEIKISNKNVVIAAQQFNPSIINQLWLVKNGILTEEEFEDNCIFVPGISQIQSREFALLVVPVQLQFTPKLEADNDDELVLSKVGRIIEKLPHTPFNAIGLNFIWHINLMEVDMTVFTRSLFWRDIPLFHEFENEDALFGAYLSKNVLGSRLKLDIKPILQIQDSIRTNFLQFAFNYHLDLPAGLPAENKVENILGLLRKWGEAKKLSDRIVRLVEKGS